MTEEIERASSRLLLSIGSTSDIPQPSNPPLPASPASPALPCPPSGVPLGLMIAPSSLLPRPLSLPSVRCWSPPQASVATPRRAASQGQGQGQQLALPLCLSVCLSVSPEYKHCTASSLDPLPHTASARVGRASTQQPEPLELIENHVENENSVKSLDPGKRNGSWVTSNIADLIKSLL